MNLLIYKPVHEPFVMILFWNSIAMDDFPSKRPCIEPPCSLGEEEYNVGPMHLSWSQTPMHYPSLLYQHQAEANLPVNSVASKVTRAKHSRINGYHSNIRVDRDLSSRFDVWGLSAESRLASVLTEDDFLEMVLCFYLCIFISGLLFFFPHIFILGL